MNESDDFDYLRAVIDDIWGRNSYKKEGTMDAKYLAEVQEGHTRVSREDLLARLKENKQKHEAEHNEAIEGWQVMYAKSLTKEAEAMKEHAAKIADGVEVGEFDNGSHPIRPISHVEDYERIICRMGMSKDEEIFISHSDFERYVLDNWRWKEAHTRVTRMYGKTAMK